VAWILKQQLDWPMMVAMVKYSAYLVKVAESPVWKVEIHACASFPIPVQF